MRILIFSDLHANLEALLALQRVEQRPDAIFFLGDAVGYGPDPTACVAWLKQNVTAWVQGDHDAAAANGSDCASPAEWQEIAHATRAMNRALLPTSALRYLAGLDTVKTVTLDGVCFRLSHCGCNAFEPLTAPEERFEAEFERTDANVILCGHTHVPMLRRVRDRWFVNPGSLGQPRHGLPSATYAVWNDGDLRIQHIDYDPRVTIQKLALLPLDPEHVARLQETLRVGM